MSSVIASTGVGLSQASLQDLWMPRLVDASVSVGVIRGYELIG